jgi:hypothetical protein
MKFSEFKNTTTNILNKYFSHIYKYKNNIRIDGVSPSPRLCFPNGIFFIETDTHFYFEICRNIETFTELIKYHDQHFSKIENYLSHKKNSNSKTPLWRIDNNKGVCLSQLYFLTGVVNDNEENIKKRFPYLYDEGITKIVGGYDCIPFSFTEKTSNIIFDKLTILNSSEKFTRLKCIKYGFVLAKIEKINKFSKYLKKTLKETFKPGNSLIGIGIFTKNEIAASVNSFVLSESRAEPEIDKFITKHPDLLTKGLGYVGMVSQTQYPKGLEWQEWDKTLYPEKPVNIKPDIFLLDSENKLHILDFKLPQLDKKLVVGEERNRAFTSYINQGIGQISKYAEYFKYEKNQKYAKKILGFEIHVNPEKILIVGNYENYVEHEIKQALLAGQNVMIVNYDLLITNYFYNLK